MTQLALDRFDGSGFAERLRQGDAGVLQWIAERCARVAGPQFSAWAWRWIRDDFVADLTGQMAMATRNEAFELRGPAEAYVDTAVRNLCRSYFFRVARLRKQVPIEAAGQEASPVPDSLTQVAAAIDLKRALDRLSPDCRDLIRAKYFSDRSLQEIGDDLGIQEKTARSRLHACREALRALWFESTKPRPGALE